MAQSVTLAGYAQQDGIARSEQAGFDAHLAKPVSFRETERLLFELPVRMPE
jgi:CheY-like chemotaxis protein